MKCLSIQQPYANFVCSGVKTVENRSWKTDYRGRILIHASGYSFAWPDADFLPESYLKRMEPFIGVDDLSDLPKDLLAYHNLVKRTFSFYSQEFSKNDNLEWLESAVKKFGYALPAMSIVGEAELANIVETCDNEFADESRYHWILENPVLYDKPVANVVGRLRLWEYRG